MQCCYYHDLSILRASQCGCRRGITVKGQHLLSSDASISMPEAPQGELPIALLTTAAPAIQAPAVGRSATGAGSRRGLQTFEVRCLLLPCTCSPFFDAEQQAIYLVSIRSMLHSHLFAIYFAIVLLSLLFSATVYTCLHLLNWLMSFCIATAATAANGEKQSHKKT